HPSRHDRILVAVWNQDLLYYSSLPITAQDQLDGFAYPTPLLLGRTYPSLRIPYPPASPRRSNGKEVVQEYLPVVHRLRLSASASVPTNPERTSLPQETLGFR